jgi:hypothetical protein
MKYPHLFVISLLFIWCTNTSLACTTGEEGCTVDKTEWASWMRHRIPHLLCLTDSPYLKCSETSQTQCKSFASKEMDACWEENGKNIPPLLNRTESGKWGETLGECVGKGLTKHIVFQAEKHVDCPKYLSPPTETVPPHHATIEAWIHNSPKLRQLDEEMKLLYLQIEVETLGVDGETGTLISPIREDQLTWENTVKNQCQSIQCLEASYIQRISHMKKTWKEAL